MITKSLYSDFSQIANSTAKEIDIFLLERILSLETLSHNEGMKVEIVGVDDTGKKHDSLIESEVTDTGSSIKNESTVSTGAIENSIPPIRRNILRRGTSSGALSTSGVVNTTKISNLIQENEHLQEVLEDFIKINTTFHSVEIISASGQTIAYMVENE